jgi:hypothetical protein
MTQVHTRFTDYQVKELTEPYIHHEVERTYAQEMLGIGKSQFFLLIQRYCENPEFFYIAYGRYKKTRGISLIIESHILEELAVDKALIDDPSVPMRRRYGLVVKAREEQTHIQP